MSGPIYSASSSSGLPIPSLDGFNVGEKAGQVKDQYIKYANLASPYVTNSVKRGVEFVQDKTKTQIPTIAGYKVNVLSHNVKEGVLIALTVLTIVKVASFLFIAFSFKTALTAGISLVLRDVISRSMDEDLKEVNGKSALKKEKQGSDAIPAPVQKLNSNKFDDSSSIEGSTSVPKMNPLETADNEGQSSKSSPPSALKSSSVDAALTFVFRNFVDKNFEKREWTSFVFKA